MRINKWNLSCDSRVLSNFKYETFYQGNLTCLMMDMSRPRFLTYTAFLQSNLKKEIRKELIFYI